MSLLRAGALPAPMSPAEAGETLWRDNDGRVAAYGRTDGTRHWMRMPGVGTFHWRDGSDEMTVAAPPRVSQAAVEDAFRRCVLPMALSTRGCQVLHAGAVLGPEGVVALCARSQTGKSTLARGLAGRPGRALWGDDAVAFATSPGGVEALPLPFALSLRPASAAHFAGSGDAPLAPGDDPVPLAAVFVLARADGAGEPVAAARRVAPADAFTAVLEHAYCFDLDGAPRRRDTAEQYLELTARAPVYELRFRTGLEHLEPILDEIERAVAAGASAPGATAAR
jgi:hypothetical protein